MLACVAVPPLSCECCAVSLQSLVSRAQSGRLIGAGDVASAPALNFSAEGFRGWLGALLSASL